MSAAVCLALAIWFEAGIEPPVGQIAVGWSVVNASQTLHRRPVTVCSEVYSGRYMAINDQLDEHRQISIPSGKRWKQTLHLAESIIHRKIPDPTHGSTHFECTRWAACANPPPWAKDMTFMGKFGSQLFFKERRCQTNSKSTPQK